MITDSYADFCDRLLDVPEIRRCFAEEIVMREALPALYSFDYMDVDGQLLAEWTELRSDLMPMIDQAFDEHYPTFKDRDERASRLKFFQDCLRKLDAHLGGEEFFESCEFLGGDPYVLVAVDSIADPVKLGNCVTASYSLDLKHLERLSAEIQTGNMVRALQRKVCPFFEPVAFEMPDSWSAAMKLRETVQYFRDFEREHPIPAFLTSEEQFSLDMPPRGCRLRDAVEVLMGEGLPERIPCLYGISLYETNAMLRFCSENKGTIDAVESDDDRLKSYIVSFTLPIANSQQCRE